MNAIGMLTMSSSCVLHRCSSRSSGPSNSGSVTRYAVLLAVGAQRGHQSVEQPDRPGIGQADSRGMMTPRPGRPSVGAKSSDQQDQHAVRCDSARRTGSIERGSRPASTAAPSSGPSGNQVEEHQHDVEVQTEAQDHPSSTPRDAPALPSDDDDDRHQHRQQQIHHRPRQRHQHVPVRCRQLARVVRSGWSAPACPRRSAGRPDQRPRPAAARWSRSDRCAPAATASAAPACAACGRPACRRRRRARTRGRTPTTTNAIK